MTDPAIVHAYVTRSRADQQRPNTLDVDTLEAIAHALVSGPTPAAVRPSERRHVA